MISPRHACVAVLGQTQEHQEHGQFAVACVRAAVGAGSVVPWKGASVTGCSWEPPYVPGVVEYPA